MYLSMNIGRTITEEPDLKNRLLYKTLELELQKEGGLKVVKNSFNETVDLQQFDSRKRFDLIPKDIKSGSIRVDTANIENKQYKSALLQQSKQLQQTQLITQRILKNEEINDHSHNGLLSALLFQSQQKQKLQRQIQQQEIELKENSQEFNCLSNGMKLMICITMFREPLTQLLKSIDGIVDSLQSFVNYGIAPHQIGICVFFDGIENIHNVVDENGGSFHENIIPYFKAHLDEEYGIRGKKTLDHQYWEYKKHKKYLNDYKPQNIIEMRRNKEYLLKKYKKHKDNLLTIMKARKNGGWLPQDEWIEANIIDAMIHQYHLSKKYIDDRANCAWIYQGRYVFDGCTMPIFYTFKFQNGSKLSSHLWFFKGFCQELKPDYCLLMDCGAIPGPGSIFKLIMSMEADPKIGGVCGNMRIEEEAESDKQNQPMDIISRILNQFIFSIQKCQACEYDIGHVLDKHYESALNYIHVLPGAFSAYRYIAFEQPYVMQSKELDQIKTILKNFSQNEQEIQQQSQYLIKSNDSSKSNILDFYLKQVVDKNYEYSSITEANMFLAEDRVLCLLLFCQNYYLKYVPDAEVYVDACQTLVDLLYQRRRWINGSWFALNYVQDNFHEKLKNSDHSWLDQQLFKFSLVSAGISQIQQYFFQTFQIVWLYMILQVMFDTSNINDQVTKTSFDIIVSAILTCYLFLVIMLIFLSITFNQQNLNSIKCANEKEKQKRQDEIKSYYFSKYYGVSTILGLISLGTLAYTFYLLIQDIIIDTNIKLFIQAPDVPQSYYYLFVVISCGMLAIPFLLTLLTNPKSIFNILINSIHYFYYQPTYTHLFITYAFCRIDDLSWGTKGLTLDNDAKKINTDKIYKKYLFIIKWIILNCLASGILIMFLRMEVFLLPQCLILIISVVITMICCLKSILAIYNFFSFYHPFGQRAERNKLIKKQNKLDETLRKGRNFNDELQKYFNAKSN